MKFIRDQYRVARGDRSQMLAVTCDNCGAFLFHYQKDGPGPLKRCYTDRIIDVHAIEQQASLTACSNCHFPFGLSIVYEKESRPAIRLFVGAVKKKVVPLRVI